MLNTEDWVDKYFQQGSDGTSSEDEQNTTTRVRPQPKYTEGTWKHPLTIFTVLDSGLMNSVPTDFLDPSHPSLDVEGPNIEEEEDDWKTFRGHFPSNFLLKFLRITSHLWRTVV